MRFTASLGVFFATLFITTPSRRACHPSVEGNFEWSNYSVKKFPSTEGWHALRDGVVILAA
ncbi:MAG: hypothetical protein FWC80_06310 [Firmicutes bacterium]|nr:hypothetical protein [Bacillota bacterium]